MLVDDDARNAILPKKFHQVESYEITYADNGPTAWKLHPSKCSDLMPLDVNMPETNGFELARLIRRQDHHMLILLLTNNTEITDSLTGFHPKGNDYIPKPFYPEEHIAKKQGTVRALREVATGAFHHGHDHFRCQPVCGEARRGAAAPLSPSNRNPKDVGREHRQSGGAGCHTGSGVDNASYANSLALNVPIPYLHRLLKAHLTLTPSSLKKRGYILRELP